MTQCNRLAVLAVPTLLLASCGGSATPAAASVEVPPAAWQQVIRERDRKRLASLWSAWTRSLRQVAAAGDGPDVAALGMMAAADAVDNGPLPTPGRYRCRTVKLGSRNDNSLASVHSAMSTPTSSSCTIVERNGLLWFEQGSGAQRIGGRLYRDGDRMVFLGSLALAGEMGFRSYGADAERDQVGVLRSIGDSRWRLELPWPMWQANLAIIEIVAA